MRLIHRIKNLITYSFSKSIFSKMITIDAAIIVIILTAFTLVVTHQVSSVLVNKQISYNNIMLNRIYDNFLLKTGSSYRILQSVYKTSDDSSSLFQFMSNTDENFYVNNPFGKKQLSDTLRNIVQSDADIIGIALYKYDNNTYYYFSRGQYELSNIGNEISNYSPLKSMNIETVYFSMPSQHYGSPYWVPSTHSYGIAYNLISPSNYKTLGKFILLYKSDNFKKKDIEDSDNVASDILIMNKDGYIIYDSEGRNNGKIRPDLLPSRNVSSFIDKKNKNLVNNKSVDDTLSFVSITPLSQINSTVTMIKRNIFIICIIFIFLSIPVHYFQIRGFTRRINTIIDVMQKARAGNLGIRIPSYGKKDEIEQIAANFNNTYDELNDYINRVYVSEIKQKSAEISTLQSKINPHFMFNTLEAVRMHAVADGNSDVGEMVYKLATLFRTLFKGNPVITIEDELDSCELYVEIFKIRYDDILQFECDISEEVLRAGIPRNLLLPIVENYLIHGFDPNLGDNVIKIKGRLQKGCIELIVTDNGKGISEDKLSDIRVRLNQFQITNNGSIGLANVNDRIKIIFDEQYGLEITSIVKQGTTVIITLPAKTAREIEEMLPDR